MRKIVIVDNDGTATLYPDFLSSDEARAFFKALSNTLAWQEESIKIYGKEIKVPRLVSWYGEPGTVYTYSGVAHTPRPWTEELLLLKDKVMKFTGLNFNSVLANLYRNQQDSMGWHSDNEKELGPVPVIASLSLGETRLFKLQHKRSKVTVDCELTSGSLLVMSGSLQSHWRHSVPKTKLAKSARVNLTFRQIHN